MKKKEGKGIDGKKELNKKVRKKKERRDKMKERGFPQIYK